MKSFKINISAMRDLYSFMYFAQECKGKIYAYSSDNKSRQADGKSTLGLMSLNTSKPIIVEFTDNEDAKRFERYEVLDKKENTDTKDDKVNGSENTTSN